MIDNPKVLRLLKDASDANKKRQKTGQDAKRWKYFMGMLDRGEAVIMMGAVPIVGDLLPATIDHIDDGIKDDYNIRKKNEAARRRHTE